MIHPKLSIIIPCYNYAFFLRSCLDSILEQDYHNYELILVDDGSTDETWEVLQEYAAVHSHVRVFKSPTNEGPFKASQRGWNEALGTYLHFFSADDLYHPGCLSKIMTLFHNHPKLGLVCTDLNYFQNESGQTTTKNLLPEQNRSVVFTPQEAVSLFQKTDFWIPGLTCIMKADIVKKYGHFDSKLENISDWFYFHKIALLEGLGYIPEALISMRLHDQTYTSRVKKDKSRRRATYRHLLKILSENRDISTLFKKSGLLTFIFREFGWRIRVRPRYFGYWHYLK